MEFSWWAFWATIAVWLFQPVLSFKEKTFSRRQMFGRRRGWAKFHGRYRWQHLPMSFLNNWTVSVGDLLVFPIVNGLVVPQLWPAAGWELKYPVFFFIGNVVSIIAHRIWWGHDENLGHVFKKWEAFERAFFMADLTRAGWAHFWFMVAQATVVLAYFFSPMPPPAVYFVSGLLIIFVMIQQAQAVLVQNGSRGQALATAAIMIPVVAVIAILKLA
jgi:hypothetical protein